jgi:hypothetical protein
MRRSRPLVPDVCLLRASVPSGAGAFSPRPTRARRTIRRGAKVMGTSVRMIEKSYGVLLDGAGAGIASRLDALDAEREAHALADAAPYA